MLAYAGRIIVPIAAAQALARVMPDWAASLIVGGIVLLVGTILTGVARKALSPSGMIPNPTMRNIEVDARVIKQSPA